MKVDSRNLHGLVRCTVTINQEVAWRTNRDTGNNSLQYQHQHERLNFVIIYKCLHILLLWQEGCSHIHITPC